MGGRLQGGREAGKNIGLETDELVWPLAVCPWLCAQVTYPFRISTRSLSENGDLNLKLHRIGLGVVRQQLGRNKNQRGLGLEGTRKPER